mmetsp:Transcript_102125/g.271781  ORF Transcript_102125/g.271781 Transcript_102125/m.271781 type:complete len:256 (+) Transcript_102125:472-1239(+)
MSFSHLAAMSFGSSEHNLMTNLSPCLQRGSGKSASQSSGSLPVTRTSAGASLLSLAMMSSWLSPRKSFLPPQKMACPLLPPKPKEETWLWPCVYFQFAVSVSKTASNASCSKCGFSVRKWTVGQHLAYLHCRTHLQMPPMAAPPSKWPMLVLFDVSIKGSNLGILIWIFLTAPTSMGSPSEVPVPWHSHTVDSGAVICASLTALAIISYCAGPLGAVKLALRPSCPTCVARMIESLWPFKAPHFIMMPLTPSPRK